MVADSRWRPSRAFLCIFGALLASAAPDETLEAVADEAGPLAAEESDPTKELLAQLTIGMVSEVVDERTFEIRDAAGKTGRKRLHIRLGNVAPLVKAGGTTDEQHEARIAKSKAALEKMVAKQMLWWKAGPDEHQPPMPDDKDAPGLIIGDAWLIDGRHINSFLMKEGHLQKEELYQSELARDILTAEADANKKTAYKELEEALKESSKQKQKEEQERIQEEKMKPEPIGIGGYVGLGFLGIVVIGGLCNFGRAGGGKRPLGVTKGQKKRGFFGTLWTKLKGA